MIIVGVVNTVKNLESMINNNNNNTEFIYSLTDKCLLGNSILIRKKN
jgi:hypothetical protein